METNTQTNLGDLSEDRKVELTRKLRLSRELMEEQALIAEAKTRIAKAKLEEVIFTVKLFEFKEQSESVHNEAQSSESSPEESQV